MQIAAKDAVLEDSAGLARRMGWQGSLAAGRPLSGSLEQSANTKSLGAVGFSGTGWDPRGSALGRGCQRGEAEATELL